MDEKVFFESDDVRVTNARFISAGQTYVMSNITSVKTYEEKPSRMFGIIGVILGLIIASSALVLGLIVSAGAAFFLYKQKTTYHVLLATAGGETRALKTYEPEYLSCVVSALNEAIVHRG